MFSLPLPYCQSASNPQENVHRLITQVNSIHYREFTTLLSVLLAHLSVIKAFVRSPQLTSPWFRPLYIWETTGPLLELKDASLMAQERTISILTCCGPLSQLSPALAERYHGISCELVTNKRARPVTGQLSRRRDSIPTGHRGLKSESCRAREEYGLLGRT